MVVGDDQKLGIILSDDDAGTTRRYLGLIILVVPEQGEAVRLILHHIGDGDNRRHRVLRDLTDGAIAKRGCRSGTTARCACRLCFRGSLGRSGGGLRCDGLGATVTLVSDAGLLGGDIDPDHGCTGDGTEQYST